MKNSLLAMAALFALPHLATAQTLPPATPGTPNPHTGGMPKAAPGSANPHAKAAPSPWAELADYTLTIKVPPKGEAGTWKIRTFADPGDVVIELDTPAPKGRTRGTIMLVSGQGIAVRGFTPEAGFELDPLDSAILNFKILTQLLDAALPAGPESAKGQVKVNAQEAKSPIIASTPTANASFLAPWSLKGTIERAEGDKVAFSLELEAPVGDKASNRAKWNFSGTASGSAQGRVPDDGTSLAGWTAYRLAPAQAKATHATLKFGVTRLEGPFATLKDFRAALSKAPAPAAPKAAPAKKP